MARITKPLTETQIKLVKRRELEYTLSDGNGLYLLVKPNGSKIWRFNYYRPITKKRALISLGCYPEVTLQQSRKLREQYRDLIAKDIDPKQYREDKLKEQQAEINNTFYIIALKWQELRIKKGLSPKTLKQSWAILENHFLPYFKNTPINQIKAINAINALQKLADRECFNAIQKLCGIVNEIMYYAVNMGIIENNPLAKISAVFSNHKPERYKTIKPSELPEFMQALSMARIELQTRCVIEWQLLTMTRPSEASGTRWDEIDIDRKLWIIPAERMKMGREHIIPLSVQAINVLNKMKAVSSNRDYVFPNYRPPYNKPMYSSTSNVAIARMGFKDRLVAHGLRSLASTVLNEQGFNYDVIESALAHVDKNAVRRAYNRAEYEQQKRIMLDWWGNFIEQASNGNVHYQELEHLK